LPWATELVTSEDRRHCTNETSDVVDRGHSPLSVCRWVAEGVEEVLIDDDIAEDALVVAIELSDCCQSHACQFVLVREAHNQNGRSSDRYPDLCCNVSRDRWNSAYWVPAHRQPLARATEILATHCGVRVSRKLNTMVLRRFERKGKNGELPTYYNALPKSKTGSPTTGA
jgi:hypothetical protein